MTSARLRTRRKTIQAKEIYKQLYSTDQWRISRIEYTSSGERRWLSNARSTLATNSVRHYPFFNLPNTKLNSTQVMFILRFGAATCWIQSRAISKKRKWNNSIWLSIFSQTMTNRLGKPICTIWIKLVSHLRKLGWDQLRSKECRAHM